MAKYNNNNRLIFVPFTTFVASTTLRPYIITPECYSKFIFSHNKATSVLINASRFMAHRGSKPGSLDLAVRNHSRQPTMHTLRLNVIYTFIFYKTFNCYYYIFFKCLFVCPCVIFYNFHAYMYMQLYIYICMNVRTYRQVFEHFHTEGMEVFLLLIAAMSLFVDTSCYMP